MNTAVSARTLILAAAAIHGLARVAAAQPAAPDPEAAAAIASRLELSAIEQMAAPDAAWPRLQMAFVTLEQAARLDPNNPRYARLLGDLALRLGDSAAALKHIEAYRKLQPDDQLAQIQFIDLTAAKRETAEARLDYFKQVSAAPPAAVADAVRSHAAAQAAHVYDERGDAKSADEWFATALKINPLNLSALQATEARAAYRGDRVTRFKALLDLLRANIAQPAVMNTVASELAGVGLNDEAIFWYQQSLSLSQRNNAPPDLDDYLDYASVLVSAGQSTVAGQRIDELLKARPESVPGHFLKLLLVRKGKDAAATEAASKAAHDALLIRLNGLSMTLAGSPPKDDAPAPAQLPDLAADLAKLKAKPNPALSQAYLESLADLAWVTVYFDGKPLDAAVADAIKSLAGENSPLVARLDGWGYLAAGKPVEARQKLDGIADTDALAAMGVIRLRAAAGEDVTADARKLLARAPSGVVGAIVASEISSRAGDGPVIPDAAEALRAELQKFPTPLLRIIDTPDTFYTVRIDPIKVAHDFGDAIYMKVSVTNRSDYPLTLGAGGVVGPTLSIDCATRGIATQGFGETARETLRQVLVLQPKQTMQQLIRVDGPTLRQELSKNPAMSMPLYFSIVTNPVYAENGPVPGAAGYRRPSERVVERISNAVQQPTARDTLLNDVQRGKPARRVAAAEAIAANGALLLAQIQGAENLPDDQKAAMVQAVQQLGDALNRVADTDQIADVRAWASYLRTLTSNVPDARAALIRNMLRSAEPTARFLGVDALTQLPTETAVPALTAAAGAEADELVKRYATAAIEVAKLPPTTKPAEEKPETP